MKYRDIDRARRDQGMERMTGDAPTLGHVVRVRDKASSKGTWRKRKRGAGGDHLDRQGLREGQSKLLVMWSVALAVIVFAIIGGAIWVWGLTQSNQVEVTEIGKAATPVGEKRVVSRFPSPSQKEALDLVKRALAIRDPREVTEVFRLGSASPEAVTGFLRDREAMDGAVTDFIWLSSMDANGLLLDGVVVNTKDGEKLKDRLALLTPDENGRWKIDFEAFARAVKPAWSEILAAGPGQGLIRVIFARDNYYNGPFKDEAQWVCYRLGSPDLDKDITGYCRKDSPQAAALERMVTTGTNLSRIRLLKRATLEVRRPTGAESRQFEIVRVAAEDWVMSDTPFDGSRR